VNKLERETFDSVDAAMTVPTHALLELMLKVKARGDSQSAANLATAMDRKNPTISIDVKLLESPSFWPGDDTVNVWAEGSKQTATKALTMSEGGHSKMTCKWTDVFSAATVTRASTLTIWGGVKDKLGASIDVAFPFNSGGGSIGGNDGADGKIQFTMTMA